MLVEAVAEFVKEYEKENSKNLVHDEGMRQEVKEVLKVFGKLFTISNIEYISKITGLRNEKIWEEYTKYEVNATIHVHAPFRPLGRSNCITFDRGKYKVKLVIYDYDFATVFDIFKISE